MIIPLPSAPPGATSHRKRKVLALGIGGVALARKTATAMDVTAALSARRKAGEDADAPVRAVAAAVGGVRRVAVRRAVRRRRILAVVATGSYKKDAVGLAGPM